MQKNISFPGRIGAFFPIGKRRRLGHKHWLRQVRTFETDASGLTDSEIWTQAEAIRSQMEERPGDNQQAAFCGLVAEAVFRVQGFRLHNVQINAVGAALAGNIVEMQTGEGKTVVTGAIAAVKTLEFTSVHVGTTNAYLAERDLHSLSGVFAMLGITSSLLPDTSSDVHSRRAYRAQIVYGPGYQFGFDYLRDQMELRKSRSSIHNQSVVNRIRGLESRQKLIQCAGHSAALIDEADSVMIDEAMTPLIISMPGKKPEDPVPYQIARKIADSLVDGQDYTIEYPAKKIVLDDDASQSAHDQIAQKSVQLSRPWRTYIANAIRADRILTKDIDYVVVDGEVQIVDQFTGRILPDRTWQDGLHQAVEARENLPIQPGRDSTTQITRQRYLQLYEDLAGLTGTAVAVSQEFEQVYGCRVVPVPTNKPCIREVLCSRFFIDTESRLNAIAEEVCTLHRRGQPVLVGTKTIRESYEVRDALVARNLSPVLLNGVQDEEEAEIVAAAGQSGAITIATNMAGRGTDIKPDERALAAGGLRVIGVSPNASQRIDRQLAGRAARQGQPGSVRFFAAATDAIFTENNSPLPKSIARRARKDGESGDFSREVARLQTEIETRKFKQRQDMILRDKWMDTVREAVEKE